MSFMVICMGGRCPNPKESGTSTVIVPVTLSCVMPSGTDGARRSIFYFQIQVVQSILQILTAVLYILPALVFDAQNILQAGVHIAAGNIL